MQQSSTSAQQISTQQILNSNNVTKSLQHEELYGHRNMF